jgi:hypothetical protein
MCCSSLYGCLLPAPATGAPSYFRRAEIILRIRGSWFLICAAALLVATAWASDPGSPAEAVINPRGLRIPRLQQAPTLDDFLSMQPSARTQRMARVSAFVQRDPSEGPATQRTDVYLGYDQNRLYTVFVCFDGSPELVRSHLAPRTGS